MTPQQLVEAVHKRGLEFEPYSPTDSNILLFESHQADAAETLQDDDPCLWIENEIIFRPAVNLAVNVQSRTNNPIPYSIVDVVLPNRILRAQTDDRGIAEFDIPDSTSVQWMEAQATGYWPHFIKPGTSTSQTITCDRLPLTDSVLGWWHHAVGIHQADLSLGKGIRIGIIDTMVASHAALQHVERIGMWTNIGEFFESRGVPHYHGTHVCGILGARPRDAGYVGICPDADIHAAAVLEEPSQAAIALAITRLVEEHNVHLINVSLEADTASNILAEAISEATGQGCLVFAASGNATGAGVRFPASCSDVVAVSAIGKSKGYPKETVCALYESNCLDVLNDYFYPEFSCNGPEINCCAPGIGIISTATLGNADEWGCENGTSMAAPVACGMTAAILSRHIETFSGLNPEKRVEFARETLYSACRDIGFETNLIGMGMPYLA